MLINIVLYVPTVVINVNNIFTCDFSTSWIFLYNKFIETEIRLVDERYVTSFLGNLQGYIIDIDVYMLIYNIE